MRWAAGAAVSTGPRGNDHQRGEGTTRGRGRAWGSWTRSGCVCAGRWGWGGSRSRVMTRVGLIGLYLGFGWT